MEKHTASIFNPKGGGSMFLQSVGITCSSTRRYIALMMEAARTSETLANFYQTTRRYNPEDSHLHTHRRENLKSY
jgi:hypothetical protein